MVNFVNDRMLFIVLGGQCDVIFLNVHVHVPTG